MTPGTVVEVGPAYSMKSGRRDHYDEWSGCEGWISADTGGADVLVYVKARGEVWINRGRLRVHR